jgi:hypothetical protein
LRSSDSWVEPEHASTRGSHLPCPSAPLQSMTAAASRRIPFSGPGSWGVCAGQEHPGTRVAYCATGAGRHPKVMGRLLGPRGGRTQPLARVDRNARSGCRSVPGREPRLASPGAILPEGGMNTERPRCELRYSVTEVPEWRALRVAGPHRSGDRLGETLRGRPGGCPHRSG